jgi:hypothetical protein
MSGSNAKELLDGLAEVEKHAIECAKHLKLAKQAAVDFRKTYSVLHAHYISRKA